MVWQILLCALAAAGLLFLLWVAIGLLLMPLRLGHGFVLLFVQENADHLEQSMRAASWLIGSGLLRTTVLLADTQGSLQVTELAKRLSESYPWAVWLSADALPDYLKNLERTES